MAEPFKNSIGPPQVRALADALAAVDPAFDPQRFTKLATAGLQAKELKARARHVADALEATLPEAPAAAFDRLVRAMRPALTETTGFDFLYLPVSEFLERHGPRDLPAALAANHALTQRFSSEFCVRALLEHHPAATLRELRRWTDDESPHVRRLCSEGTRPRLPWGRRVAWLIEDPGPGLALCARLRDDPSEYVRRSVANHLNDVSKDHPERVVKLCRSWLRGASTERRRLVEHGLRTLVKRGSPDALALLGADGSALTVEARCSPAKATLGGALTVQGRVENPGERPVHVIVDVRVSFVGARGLSPKVFKVARFDLAPAAAREVSFRLPLVHRSIRKLHAGHHPVALQVNGRLHELGGFTLRLG